MYHVGSVGHTPCAASECNGTATPGSIVVHSNPEINDFIFIFFLPFLPLLGIVN
jgi:hypothetical protein